MKDKNATPKGASPRGAALRDLPPGAKLSPIGTTTVAPSAQTAVPVPAMTLPPAPPVPPHHLLVAGTELAAHHFAKATVPGGAATPQPGRVHRPTFDEPPAHITALREHARGLRRSLGGMLRVLEQGVPAAEELLTKAEGDAEVASVFTAEGLDLKVARAFVDGARNLVTAFEAKEETAAPETPPIAP
jgi:hypothetical protein